MPELPDEDSTAKANSSNRDDDARGTKRRHSTVPDEEDAHKRT